MKRSKKIIILFILVFFIIVGFTMWKSNLFIKKEIVLKNKGNKLEWILNKENNLKDHYFILYRNNKEIYRGNTLNFTDLSIVDKKIPNTIDNIKVSYQNNKTVITWQPPNDNGQANSYKVFLVDSNEKKKFKSNKLIYNYTSNIAKYVISIGNKNLNSTVNSVEFDRNDLSEGVFKVNIIAIDNSGNVSKPSKTIEIRNYKIELANENEKIKLINNDKEQKYDYKLFVNNQEKEKVSNTFDYDNVLNYLSNDTVLNISHTLDNMDYSFSWDLDKYKAKFTYFVEGTGKKYNNKVYTSETAGIHDNDIVGYYYKIGKESNYEITKADSFTKDKYIKINVNELEAGDNTFYIASMDSNSKLSLTHEYNLKVYNKEKLEKINSLLVKDKNTNEKSYNNERTSLVLIADNVLDYIISKGTKVYFTNKSLGKVKYMVDGKRETSEIGGHYDYVNNRIMIKNKLNSSVVLHEIGHLIDFKGTENAIHSSKKEFVDIYNKERLDAFPDYDYPRSSSEEYFAGAFAEYVANSKKFKVKAPLTYDYFDRIISSIK